MSRDKAMDAAIQLHRDVCLMTTNLDILDQYALSLQGTASKLLELKLGSSEFPVGGRRGGCPGAQSTPRFNPDGGYGSMATLVRSNHPGLELLVRNNQTFYGQYFLSLSLYFTVYVALLPAAARHIRLQLVRVFSGLPPCVGYFRKLS